MSEDDDVTCIRRADDWKNSTLLYSKGTLMSVLSLLYMSVMFKLI